MAIDKCELAKKNKKEKQTNVCKELDLYIKIIYKIGNKIILQKTLFDILNELNVQHIRVTYKSNLNLLESLNIIKITKYSNSGYNLIILRNFGIRYVENTINNSKSSASLPKFNMDKIFAESRLKSTYFLQYLKDNKKIKELAKSPSDHYEKLLNSLDNQKSTIFIKATDGVKYLKKIGLIYKDLFYRLNAYTTEQYTINDYIEREININNITKNNLLKDDNKIKTEKVEDHTIMRMKKRKIDIEKIQFSKLSKTFYIDVVYWGIEKKYSQKEIDNFIINTGEVLAYLYKLIDNTKGINYIVKINYIGHSEIQCKTFLDLVKLEKSRNVNEKTLTISRVNQLYQREHSTLAAISSTFDNINFNYKNCNCDI